ncbi:MAG: hypothetical protein DRQ41_12770, partial [Gammaproteobacteria bacterium]
MKKILTVILSLFIISSCYFPNNKEEREDAARLADEKQKDIVIALVRTKADDNLFLEGAKLAIKEINDLGGVLTDRKIIPLIHDDVGKADVGQKIAREMAYNLDVIAVIGHRFSSVAIPVSITYEKNGIVFISTGSTTPTLTAHKSQYIFRNIPSDKIIGKALAKFTKREGFKNIAVFFERGAYGKRLSGFFREEVVKKKEDKVVKAVNDENKETNDKGVNIVATRSYFKNEDENKKSDFRPLLNDMQELNPDAIFLAASVSTATEFIKQTRSMGVYAPFIGGDSLENHDLWKKCELDAAGTYVASVFDPDYDKVFVERFKKFVKNDLDKSFNPEYDYEKHNYEPDAKAAQGYDAVKLLAWAIENAESTVPLEIATTLRYMNKWDGVVGPYQMTSTGDIA